MLHAHLMIRTHNRPLKQAPDAFDAVGVDVTMHPLLLRVIDRAVRRIVICDALVTGMLICIDVLRVGSRRLVDEIVKLLLVHPLESFKANWAFTLKCADNARLVPSITMANMAALTADIGFIDFNRAAQGSGINVLHRLADAMTEKPSRAIGAEGERALHLASGDALLALRHQVNREEPFPDREMAVVEDRAASNRKLILARITTILLTVLNRRNVIGVAARAFDAIWPAKLFQFFAGLVATGKFLYQFDEVHVVGFVLS